MDADGDGCAHYAVFRWCDASGEGPGWQMGWGRLRDFARDGRSALEACCLCGGGAVDSDSDDNETGGCEDRPQWRDLSGDDCATYREREWCMGDGLGPAWDTDWGSVESYAVDGVSALRACCACGGGEAAKVAAGEACTDDGPGEGRWVDSEGDGCDAYEALRWCTPARQPGPNFLGGVADFALFSNHGLTALAACCACGGGGGRASAAEGAVASPRRAELQLVYASRGEEFVLSVGVRSGGPESEVLAKLGISGHGGAIGAEMDIGSLTSAVGGWGAARYQGTMRTPPCGEGSARVHRFLAPRQLLASAAQLEALARLLRPRSASGGPPKLRPGIAWKRRASAVAPRQAPGAPEASTSDGGAELVVPQRKVFLATGGR